MDFIAFKNFLNEKNIHLFDAEYRIAYHRLNNINSYLMQNGGSYNNNFEMDKLHKLNQSTLSHLVNSLLTKNIEKTNWILNNNL